jgi:hypothetical protein
MNFLEKIFKWVKVIMRIIPVIEALYPQIIIAIETIKEEIESGYKPENIKTINIKTRLLRDKTINKLMPGVKLDRVIENTKATIKEINGGN